jgi:hypothetical protein
MGNEATNSYTKKVQKHEIDFFLSDAGTSKERKTSVRKTSTVQREGTQVYEVAC